MHPRSTDSIEIFVQHPTEPWWCDRTGKWSLEQAGAVRFGSNVEALYFCKVFHVAGVLVTCDFEGREVYRIPVNVLLGKQLAVSEEKPKEAIRAQR